MYALVSRGSILLPVLSGCRIVWQVRQEHAMLHNAANMEDTVLPMAKGVSDYFGLVSSRGYTSDWDSLSLQNVSTRHPALPPSALRGYTSRFPARADAPVEVIANQMAGILRAVEAKVRRIEVSHTLAIFSCIPVPNTSANTQVRNSIDSIASLLCRSSLRLLKLMDLGSMRMKNLTTPRVAQLNRQSHRLTN